MRTQKRPLPTTFRQGYLRTLYDGFVLRGGILHNQLPALKALNVKPSVITILVGSNDLLSPKDRLKLRRNLETLLNYLPEGTVIGNIFNRPSTPMPLRAIFAHKPASDTLLKIANKRKLIVVPLDEAFGTPWRGKLAADYYHPNDRGYEGIAHAFTKAIQKVDKSVIEFHHCRASFESLPTKSVIHRLPEVHGKAERSVLLNAYSTQHQKIQ